MSDSLQPHGLQHARLPCTSPTPGACSNSCPLSWWCHPAISSSVIPLSSWLQSLPASGSFPMSKFFASGGHSIGASASVLPMNFQDWFSLALTGLISLLSKGFSRVFSNTTVQKHQFFGSHLSLWSNSHIDTWLQKKNIALTGWTFVSKAMSLLFNMLSRLVIAFLQRSKHLVISWLQLLSAVILEPKKIKSAIVSIFSPSICHELMGLFARIFVFECWALSQLFHSPLSLSSRGSLVPLRFLPLGWYYLHVWDYWYFSQQSWSSLSFIKPGI